MKVSKYLVISGAERYAGGPVYCGSVKVATHKPKLKSTERVFKLNLDIPDELFLEPEVSIDVVVPKKLVNRKPITAETLDNITEVLEQETGVKINVTLIEPKIKSK